MLIHHHLYVSQAARAFTEDELAQIGSECADGYRQAGMTGMMLHGCGVFIELLEGDPHYLSFIMDSIRSDPRHRDVTTIVAGKAGKRVFHDWTMHVLNRVIVGREQIMGDALCLQRYLRFVNEGDVGKRTLAGMKYFRERAVELPADPAVHEAFFANAARTAAPAAPAAPAPEQAAPAPDGPGPEAAETQAPADAPAGPRLITPDPNVIVGPPGPDEPDPAATGDHAPGGLPPAAAA